MASRKISIRRVIQTLVTVVAVSGCVLALVSADRIQSARKANDIQIHIRNSNIVHFISVADIQESLFSNRHLDAKALPMARLDVHNMESIARSNPWISDAQVYIDNNRTLQILITQRVPVVRVFESSGQSYYLDTALRAVPVSARYAHYTPVFTNIPMLRNDSASTVSRGIIVWLAQFISRHPFWNAQIAEVAMNGDNSFELMPILGKQHIIIGDTSRLDDKLTNLLSFYRQVQNKVGWDRYKILDLRYDGQVVASPALPWKVPVDKALSSMSWVKAIIDATPQDKTASDPDTLSRGNDQPGAGSPQPVAQATPPPQKPPAAMPVKHTEKKPVDKKLKDVKMKAPKKPAQKLKAAAMPLHKKPDHPKHTSP